MATAYSVAAIVYALQFIIFGIAVAVFGRMRMIALTEFSPMWPSFLVLYSGIILSVVAAVVALFIVPGGRFPRRVIAAVVVVVGALISGYALSYTVAVQFAEVQPIAGVIGGFGALGSGVHLASLVVAWGVARSHRPLPITVAGILALLLPVAVSGLTGLVYMGYWVVALSGVQRAIVYVIVMVAGMAIAIAIGEVVARAICRGDARRPDGPHPVDGRRPYE